MNPARFLFLLALVSGWATARADESPSLTLPQSTPEAQGVSSAGILQFVEAAEKNVQAFHSFVILRHGQVVAEGWWAPYGAEEPHMLFSLSKSFTSTAVGLAIADGKLSLADSVLKFFPEDAPASPSKALQSMRVKDLLRMSSGQSEADIKAFTFAPDHNLVRDFLRLNVPDKPGTHFIYNTAATYMLSAIVQKVTGQTVLDFLQPRLFKPLGITHPTWELSGQGIAYGGFGLAVRTEDIARFGQLYLQKGRWNGAQLVPASWIEAATTLQTSNGSDPSSDWDQGYGYQFWRCRRGFYRGDGAFGQLCIVMQAFDAVVAVTAGTGDMQGEMNAVWDNIPRAFSAGPLAADPESDRRLAEKLAHLELPPQAGAASSAAAADVAGRTYAVAANPMALESIRFAPLRPGSQTITFHLAGTDQPVAFGNGAWVKGTVQTPAGEKVAVAASGGWTADDTYTGVLCRYRTPYSTTYRMHFTGGQVDIEGQDNVGFNGNPATHMVGNAEP